MSRGLGKVQRMLLGLIREFGEPMTFDQMLLAIGLQTKQRTKLEPSLKRSLRRALHSMLVNSSELIALGNGGRAEPPLLLPPGHPLLDERPSPAGSVRRRSRR